MSSTVSPLARRRSTVCNMSSVTTRGRPPWLPLRAAASGPGVRRAVSWGRRVIAPVRVERDFAMSCSYTADNVHTFPTYRITGVAGLTEGPD